MCRAVVAAVPCSYHMLFLYKTLDAYVVVTICDTACDRIPGKATQHDRQG
jgi:hypothetical protein